MSVLAIHAQSQSEPSEVITDWNAIAERLAGLGVQFERWVADRELSAAADQDTVLAAYAQPVQRLKDGYGFQSVDVVSVGPDHPQKDELRAKFLNEHIHSDFEVRFFVEGKGLFYLHPDENIYAVLCEKGDLIFVPAHVKHWFDMGSSPDFRSIRLFTTPDGWVAEFTGSGIAAKFPKLDEFVEAYA